MTKSIQFSDDRYEQIVKAAIQCGFRVSRGRGSQLAQFVVMASNNALHTDGGVVPPNQADPLDKLAAKKAVSRHRR